MTEDADGNRIAIANSFTEQFEIYFEVADRIITVRISHKFGIFNLPHTQSDLIPGVLAAIYDKAIKKFNEASGYCGSVETPQIRQWQVFSSSDGSTLRVLFELM